MKSKLEQVVVEHQPAVSLVVKRDRKPLLLFFMLLSSFWALMYLISVTHPRSAVTTVVITVARCPTCSETDIGEETKTQEPVGSTATESNSVEVLEPEAMQRILEGNEKCIHGKVYKVDECNTCLCDDEGGLACTKMFCMKPGSGKIVIFAGEETNNLAL